MAPKETSHMAEYERYLLRYYVAEGIYHEHDLSMSSPSLPDHRGCKLVGCT